MATASYAHPLETDFISSRHDPHRGCRGHRHHIHRSSRAILDTDCHDAPTSIYIPDQRSEESGRFGPGDDDIAY